MSRESAVFSAIALFCLAGTSFATQIVDTADCPGCFYAFPTSPTAGNPFWVNNSQDNPTPGPLSPNNFTAGLYTVLPSVSPYPTNTLQYLAASGGANAALNFLFSPSAVEYSVRVLYSNTGSTLSIGWYQNGGSTQLFTTNSYSSQPYYFTPTGDFGFYMSYVGGPSDVYRTQSSLNSSGPGTEAAYEAAAGRGAHQHFAVFSTPDPNAYIVAVEDVWGRDPKIDTYRGIFEGNGDYNDAVFLLQAVPEPATFALIGLGICGLVLVSKRRRG
jgi:hypothetical protein